MNCSTVSRRDSQSANLVNIVASEINRSFGTSLRRLMSRPVQLALVMAGAFVLYLTHSLLRFRNFEAKGYDLGIFDQAVRQYALFKEPIVPVKGTDFNILGDHFHPILALLAPFYWVWDDPRMLAVVMALALVSCAIPIYLLARRRASHSTALIASAALLLWWPFQAMVNWDFHEVTLGVPVMAWVLWALDARRHGLAVGLALILLLVREDMGVTLIAVGVFLALRRAWKPAVVAAVAGAIGFLLSTEVFIPMFSPEGEFGYWEYTALGGSPGDAVLFALKHPLQTLAIPFDHPLKIALWLLHFVPLWLLPFLSPYTLLAAPLLLSRLFNDRLNLWGPVYQYDAIISVIFLVAALDGLGRFLAWRRRRRTASAPQKQAHPQKMFTVFASSLLGCAVLGTLVFPTVFPLQRTVTGDNWAMPEHAQAYERAVDQVPDDVCVEAADQAVPHLVDRTYVGLHGDIDEDLATWMVVDTTVEELGGWDPLSPDQALERAEDLGYSSISVDDGIWVLHRDAPVSPICSTYLDR